ncbi:MULTISPECIES: hypothetical protein [Thalassospira]|uniref:hypothetical protein n=1 Tax=Thalassospira TaxID=168934 RepID=UPI000AAA1A3E|nr:MULTISPECIES: hypothetical protein [Thalassospira]MCH2273101.1 hypothetical protein [Thalassospira sp.]
MGSSVSCFVYARMLNFKGISEGERSLQRVILHLALLGTVLLLHAGENPVSAADFVLSKAEVKYPKYKVELYAGPGAQDPVLGERKGDQFPEIVQYFGTSTVAGRMHHIRFEGDSKDYWVAGDQVLIEAESSKVRITCDASQATATGNLGRGAGTEVICNN